MRGNGRQNPVNRVFAFVASDLIMAVIILFRCKPSNTN